MSENRKKRLLLGVFENGGNDWRFNTIGLLKLNKTKTLLLQHSALVAVAAAAALAVSLFFVALLEWRWRSPVSFLAFVAVVVVVVNGVIGQGSGLSLSVFVKQRHSPQLVERVGASSLAWFEGKMGDIWPDIWLKILSTGTQVQYTPFVHFRGQLCIYKNNSIKRCRMFMLMHSNAAITKQLIFFKC